MSSETNGSFALPLPRHTDARIGSEPSVWVLHSSNGDVPLLADSECDRRDTEGGVCCKDLKDGDRTLFNPDIVRDV